MSREMFSSPESWVCVFVPFICCCQDIDPDGPWKSLDLFCVVGIPIKLGVLVCIVSMWLILSLTLVKACKVCKV